MLNKVLFSTWSMTRSTLRLLIGPINNITAKNKNEKKGKINPSFSRCLQLCLLLWNVFLCGNNFRNKVSNNALKITNTIYITSIRCIFMRTFNLYTFYLNLINTKNMELLKMRNIIVFTKWDLELVCWKL